MNSVYTQQKYVRLSLGRAFDELKEAQASGKKLPDAKSLFKMMDDRYPHR